MPELTPTGAVDVVERQVRRVRRRKNLYEAQRALYLGIVAAGVAAVLLLPLALFARAEVFGVAAWSGLAALVVATAALVRSAHRRWLSRADAVAWIEAEGALGGRVRTLLELGRQPGLATGFFRPLLVSEVHATLATWTPRRLVPHRIPRSALGAALAVVIVLAALVRLAALVSPAAPSIAFDDRPGSADGRTRGAPEATADDRVIVAPGVPGDPRERPASRSARNDDSPLTRYSSALQENVREQVWGKAWERVRNALARAGTTGPEGLERDETSDGEGVDAEGTDDWNVARRDRRGGTKPDASKGRDGDETRETSEQQHASEDRAETSADDRDGGDGTSGAGNGISPADLFTGPSVDTADTNASFELSLAARMRRDKAGRRRAGGPAPDADPDAQPALAADQRREAAAHRMAVPAAYEQVVREVFAHREEP